MQESARLALSWVRANAARYGIDSSFHRGADLHVHVQSSAQRKDGASAGVAMVAALTGRAVRGDLAMTGEITLSGQVLPVAGIREVLAAHCYGLASVILPQENERHVEEELGDDLPRAVAIDYVTRVDELLDLALRSASTAGSVAAVASTEPKSRPGGTSTSASNGPTILRVDLGRILEFAQRRGS